MHATRSTVAIAKILIALFAFSCDMGSSLFTDEEIDSMYEIKVMQDGSSLADGSPVSTIKALDVSVVSIDGAPAPSLLTIELTRADGEGIAVLTFVSGAASRDGAIPVVDFARGIPEFMMPDGLPEGYYVVTATLSDSAGSELTQSSIVVLSSRVKFDPPGISVYPGTVSGGSVSLFKLEGAFPPNLDPWIRWKVDGTVLSEGFLLDRADRLIWTAPKAGGVYEASAEIFPFKPPVDHAVPALTSAGVRLPVSAKSGRPNIFADLDSWSILPLDGSFEDQGPRPGSSEPRVAGKPFLETYASGFGYVFENGSGIISNPTFLPVMEEDGHLAPFTAVFKLAALPGGTEPASGRLLTAYVQDESEGLRIGVAGGYPYVQSGSSRITANAKLPPDIARLAVQIDPAGDGAAVVFHINEAAAGGGVVSSGAAKGATAACIIAGEDGYPAVYDEVRILRGPYPAYLVAGRTNKGAALIAAAGFESGMLTAGFQLAGEGAVVNDGSLSLTPSSSLAIGAPGLPPGGASISFDLLAGTAVVSLRLENGQVLAIDSNGSILSGTGAVQSRLDPGTSKRKQYAAKLTDNGLELHGANGEIIAIPVLPAADAQWTISAAPEQHAEITRVLVTAFELPFAMSSADGAQDKSLPVTRLSLETAGIL
jgi:hypothetical protein